MTSEPDETRQGDEQQRVIVVGPDGRPVGGAQDEQGDEKPEGADDEVAGPDTVADLINQPAKVMRIGSMIKSLLDEVRNAPLDEAGRARLREVHERSIRELEQGLAPELVDELERISLPFTDDAVPTEAELRIAQAQLVGWLEGLFHGIQTALFAQQMAARAQLEEMRRAGALGPAVGDGPPGLGRLVGPGAAGDPRQAGTGSGSGTPDRDERHSGPYL